MVSKLKEKVKLYASEDLIKFLQFVLNMIKRIKTIYKTIWGRTVKNYINLKRNTNKPHRYLEIGSGSKRIPHFETLNIIGGSNVDYVFDASKRLPFANNTFDLIYTSHVLEHIAWYRTEAALKEWFRILKSGGSLEIWVPDGLKICKTLIKYEMEDKDITNKDGWYKFNPRKDPFVWASARIFTYGGGKGSLNHPNWHRALFTPKYLKRLLKRIGFIEIKEMKNTEVRGYNHGWINLGVKGEKP